MKERNTDSLPMPVKLRPFTHQQAAFDFACRLFGLLPSDFHSPGFALLAEMGCGKTLVGIALIGILYRFGLVNRVLIVAPLSILGVWESELANTADFPYHLTVLENMTAEKKKKKLAEANGPGLEIVIINYESSWRLKKELLQFHPGALLADESHRLKDNRSAQSKGIHEIADRTKYRIIMTGTVIANRELDVFSQYRAIDPRIFGTSFYAFRNRYFDMVGYGNHIPRFRQWMKDDFMKRLHCVAYRITKSEALDLPEITEEVRQIDLEPKARKLYDRLEEESYAQLAGKEVTAANVLTKILRLSQVTGGHLTDDDGNTRTVSSAKLNALADIVDSCLADGNKLVVMARFVAELDDIQAMLDKKGVKYSVIRGGVKDRQEQIDRFQNAPDTMVFVGQTSAASLGVTLTASHIMCFYSLDYNMASFDQAKARIHRVSQKNNCLYIYLVARDSIDSHVLKSLRNKIDLAHSLVDSIRQGKNPFKN